MESLYHLHPIFEFCLTAYFGFIVAPKFLSEFMGSRIQNNKHTSTQRVIGNLTQKNNLIKQIVDSVTEYSKKMDGKNKQRFDIHISIGQQFPPLIAQLITRIKDQDGNQLEQKVINFLNFRFNKLFPLACLYCFSILLLNGCVHILHDSNSDIITRISYYNCLALLIMMITLGRSRFFKKLEDLKSIVEFKWVDKVRKKKFKALYGLISLAISFLIVFFLVNNFKCFISDNSFYKISTIVSTIIIAITPLLFYAFFVNNGSTKCVETGFDYDLNDLYRKMDIFLAEVAKDYKRYKRDQIERIKGEKL